MWGPAIILVLFATACGGDDAEIPPTLDVGDVSIETNPLRLSAHSVTGVVTLTLDTAGVDDAVLLRLVFPHFSGEPVFGFGETFESADASGTTRLMQFGINFDSESSLNEAHVPVPLSLWPARGVGAFVEDRRPGAFDIGVERTDAVLATVTLSATGRWLLTCTRRQIRSI